MAADKKPSKVSAKKDPAQSKRRRIKVPRFIAAIGGYFVGAWKEIRQVRWPNRRSTWTSTLAVLLFTAFWALVVLGLDLMFQSVLNNLIA